MNQHQPNEATKALPDEHLRREHVVQGVVEAFSTVVIHDEVPVKKERSTYEQQRLINQAKERREKRRLKRIKYAERNNRMG